MWRSAVAALGVYGEVYRLSIVTDDSLPPPLFPTHPRQKKRFLGRCFPSWRPFSFPFEWQKLSSYSLVL